MVYKNLMSKYVYKERYLILKYYFIYQQNYLGKNLYLYFYY